MPTPKALGRQARLHHLVLLGLAQSKPRLALDKQSRDRWCNRSRLLRTLISGKKLKQMKLVYSIYQLIEVQCGLELKLVGDKSSNLGRR